MTASAACITQRVVMIIKTHLGVKLIGQELTVFTVNDIFLPVEEPVGDLELGGVLDDGDNSLELIGIEFTGTVEVRRRASVTSFSAVVSTDPFDARARGSCPAQRALTRPCRRLRKHAKMTLSPIADAGPRLDDLAPPPSTLAVALE